jgi:SAM-dependent methyltransferase
MINDLADAVATLTLLCPLCRLSLEPASAGYLCPRCDHCFATVLGIADLRDPALPRDPAEARIVDYLVEHFDDQTLEELFLARMRMAIQFQDHLGHEEGYHLEHATRGRNFFEMFQRRLAAFWEAPPQGYALDIGCGIGTSLVAMAPHFPALVGLDNSLPELILAKKNLQDHGITTTLLVCASALALPFQPGSFTYINAVNTLEHIFDIQSVMAEVYRVLQPGGQFAADSRNRFDLFMPEPHVQLRWVGYLPRRWAPRYVRWRLNVDYSVTWLLSYFDLRAALRAHFGASWRIVFPLVVAYGQPPWLDRWLRRIERVPLLRTLLLLVFPSHLVLARRSGA